MEEEKPSREELKRRLREKTRGGRNKPTPTPNQAPDVTSMALNAGIDDPTLLSMAMGMSKKKPSMNTIRDMMTKALSTPPTADDDEEAPPPENNYSGPKVSSSTIKEDDEEAPPP